MKSLLKKENAVSQIIGMVLLLGIAVLLSLTVVTISSGFVAIKEKPPLSLISVQSYTEDSFSGFKIKHMGGDSLMSGDWWISIVPVGEPPNYRRSSTDFAKNDQILTAYLTNGEGNYTITNRTISINGSANTIKSGEYDVKIIVYPFNSMVLDTVVVK
jgi:FlaG/FlaF family flagellin (archaellin)